MAPALGHDVDKLSVNCELNWMQQCCYHEKYTSNLKEAFRSGNDLIVHWDGKLMEDLTMNKRICCLSFLVFGHGRIQLLCVPKLTSGTDHDVATAVVCALDEWGLLKWVGRMS